MYKICVPKKPKSTLLVICVYTYYDPYLMLYYVVVFVECAVKYLSKCQGHKVFTEVLLWNVRHPYNVSRIKSLAASHMSFFCPPSFLLG